LGHRTHVKFNGDLRSQNLLNLVVILSQKLALVKMEKHADSWCGAIAPYVVEPLQMRSFSVLINPSISAALALEEQAFDGGL
jgi:hypothetical protein